MTRIEAIITLLGVPAWSRELSLSELQTRIAALKDLGVTRAELITAKQTIAQQKIDTLRAEAAAAEAALPDIDA